jgi:hypothetical protein
MNAAATDCRQARLNIGAAPHELSAETQSHLRGCAACQRFLDENRALDGRLRQALEVPLARFRERAAPRRRFALAASVLLALTLAGGVWLVRPQTALAGEVVRHIEHEAASWEQKAMVPGGEFTEVLRQAGVRIDASVPVTYASACPFRGHLVPHFVVSTAAGPVTVMLLPHEKIRMRTRFSESGLHGVLVPVREGSVALVTREGEVPESLTEEIAGAVRW